MKMQSIIVVLCLGLLMWIEPASAQGPHLLTVGHHQDITLSDGDVDSILAEASQVLQKNTCNVTFGRKGSVDTFASPNTPATIKTADERDAVHSEKFDVKVVKAIKFCRRKGDAVGCSWDPPSPGQPPQHRSMIVVLQQTARLSGVVWAHEFGHRTGLWHRSEADALMTACPFKLVIDLEKNVDERECNCFLGGPGSCNTPEPNPPAKCALPHSQAAGSFD